MLSKLRRAAWLWLLDRVQNLVRGLAGHPPVEHDRIQPREDVALSFLQGWWGELHPEDQAQLGGRWLSHAVHDVFLLFEPLPPCASVEALRSAAPAAFVVAEAPHQTPHGVTLLRGHVDENPVWLVWHSAGALLVTMRDRTSRGQGAAVTSALLESAKPARGA